MGNLCLIGCTQPAYVYHGPNMRPHICVQQWAGRHVGTVDERMGEGGGGLIRPTPAPDQSPCQGGYHDLIPDPYTWP